ncbi:MAG: hypothetical protein WBC82_03455 [Dehalococcoidia bacterium]
MSGVASLFKRAKHIYETEGIVALLRRAFSFVIGHFFQYQTYYILERALENVRKLNEADFLPKIDHFDLKIVSTHQEADELEADGLEFRSQIVNARKSLDKGAVAFCIFVGRELASIGWVAMTQEAKDSLNEPPYKVDFLNNEACVTAVWTNPEYRRMGLREYGAFKRHRFMLDHGVRTRRIVIAKRNIAFHTGSAKAGSRAYAEGRYLRILWWKSWRERPLSIEEQEAIRKTNEPHS